MHERKCQRLYRQGSEKTRVETGLAHKFELETEDKPGFSAA
jgi:hypothetical protein